MARWREVAAVAALLALAACGNNSGAPGEEFAPGDVARIRERTQEFTRAFNTGDVQQMVGMYADQAVFMPPNTGALRGRDSLRGFYETLLADGATDLTMESREIGGHGPVGYESGTYVLYRRPDEGPHTRDRGKYLFVLRRYAGGWLYEHAAWSSDLPAPVQVGRPD
jgi:ketosteroid isomerase-like protein